jgi:L-lactate dehydrogenase
MEKGRKVVILGAGNVGATIAYTLTLERMASEIVLIDIAVDKAKGEAMDISQGTSFYHPVNIYQGVYEDARDASIVIVTMGFARKPGQTRIDLAQANVDIARSVLPNVAKYASEAVYLVVSNPVDIMTYAIQKYTGFPDSQVFGAGTVLDTARLRTTIGESVNVNPQNVHAYVLGEHGDTAVIPWSMASIGGSLAETFPTLRSADGREGRGIDKEAIENYVRTSGSVVIGYKGATFYAISMSVRRLLSCMTGENPTIVTVSGRVHGEYGIDDVCLSLPFALNSRGLSSPIILPLAPHEEEQLRASADALKAVINSIKI